MTPRTRTTLERILHCAALLALGFCCGAVAYSMTHGPGPVIGHSPTTGMARPKGTQ